MAQVHLDSGLRLATCLQGCVLCGPAQSQNWDTALINVYRILLPVLVVVTGWLGFSNPWLAAPRWVFRAYRCPDPSPSRC